MRPKRGPLTNTENNAQQPIRPNRCQIIHNIAHSIQIIRIKLCPSVCLELERQLVRILNLLQVLQADHAEPLCVDDCLADTECLFAFIKIGGIEELCGLDRAQSKAAGGASEPGKLSFGTMLKCELGAEEEPIG